MTEEQRQQAIGRIQAKRGFWRHFAVYLAVNAFLVIIWATTSDAYFWPIWPILGWGIAIVAHAVRVYGRPSEISEEQIEREIRDGLDHG